MKKLLLSRPAFYTVDYEINPWMHIREKPNSALASSEWIALYKTLLSIGIEVELIEPVKGLPDMVFTANGGLVVGDKFVLSNFRHKERAGEAKYFEAWAKGAGFEVIKLPKDCIFEGEGDALFVSGGVEDQDTLIAGFRFRSDICSHNHIAEMTQKKVISLELALPNFYHLDTCFCPLSKDSAIYYPEAFDSYGKKILKSLFSDLIELSVEDALNFCANAIVSGTDIVMNKCSGLLRTTLEDRGFVLHELDLSEFIKSGGSAKCLVLKLD